MTFKFSRLLLVNSCAAIALAFAGCAASTSTTKTDIAANYAPKTMRLSYKKGQVVSFVAVVGQEGAQADAARNTYYKSAFPIANQFGFQRDAQFNVQAVPVGTFKPQVIIIYSWPDAEAEKAFNAHPDWPAVKATRATVWDELRVYNDVLKEDLTLTLDASKTYTLAAAWINLENPDDYAKYLSGIQTAVSQAGGRFIYTMHAPGFETHSAPFTGPDQLLLVEWDTPGGLDKFGKSADFKANAKYLGSGTSRFELSVLSPVISEAGR